jgi:hypothetical protein
MSAPVTRAEYEALLKRVGALEGHQNMYAGPPELSAVGPRGGHDGDAG